jgi:hypothetical protein
MRDRFVSITPAIPIWEDPPEAEPDTIFTRGFMTLGRRAALIDKGLFFNDSGKILENYRRPNSIFFQIYNPNEDSSTGDRDVAAWGVCNGENSFKAIRFKINDQMEIVKVNKATCHQVWELGDTGRTSIFLPEYTRNMDMELVNLKDPQGLVSSQFTMIFPL